MKKCDLSLTYLHSILDYNPETGMFLWKIKRRGRIPQSRIAGALEISGHRRIVIDHIKYAAHRLAWFYMTGIWPTYEMDHVNNVPDDNRFVNLRLVNNRWQQRANQKTRKDNQSGFKGVKQYSKNRWLARCKKHGKEVYVRGFRTPKEAHVAYLKIAVKSFGEFARAN